MPPEKPTHLQRAFKVFEANSPDPVSASSLARALHTQLGCAYEYIRRLKAVGSIEPYVRVGRRPMYVLKVGAPVPAADMRGRARVLIRVARPISQFTAAKPKF